MTETLTTSPACDDCGVTVSPQATVSGRKIWTHTGGGAYLHTARVNGSALVPQPAPALRTDLPPVEPSRTPGYVSVPRWARDLQVGDLVDARTETRVLAREDRERGRTYLDCGAFTAEFPVDGIFTCTLRDES